MSATKQTGDKPEAFSQDSRQGDMIIEAMYEVTEADPGDYVVLWPGFMPRAGVEACCSCIS